MLKFGHSDRGGVRMEMIRLAALPLLVLAIGCGHQPKADTTESSKSVVPAKDTNVPATVTPTVTPTSAPADFSIASVPVSNVSLGKFPYFGLPPKYAPQNTPKPPAFGHFLFWTGKAFRDVEGQTYMVTITAPESDDFRSYELQKNMRALFQQAGAVKVSEAKIPQAALDALPQEVRQDLLMGLGDIWNDPVETWVIRRPSEDIWIHYTTNTAQASLAVVKSTAFVPTASLLSAEQLKADLDRSGKAVIHVNFASDAATILPTSGAQMAMVAALLKGDPALKLAINGYTDDTGSAAHNLSLSDDRAKAVQAALITAGTKPDRLQAHGYGRTNPVSSNSDEAGKAANRRVELVRL